MSELSHITRAGGFLVVCDPGTRGVDHVGPSLADVAHWIIDNLSYYPSNDEMDEIERIVLDGGVAEMDLDAKSGSHTLTVIYSKPESTS